MSLYALLQRWQDIMSFAVQTEFTVQLRKQLFAAVARANWSLFTRSRSSDFLQALTIESTRIASATQNLLILAVNSGVVAVYLILAFQLSPPITALVLASGIGLWLLLRGVAAP